MEKAESIIKDALLEIGVQDVDEAIQPSDIQTGIRYLNRFMTELDAQGYELGYTLVNSANDDVTIPDGVISAVVTNLALRMTSQYGMQPSPSLAMAASIGMKTIGRVSITIPPSEYPDILPRGSGNATYDIGDNFYPDADDLVEVESGGSIIIESGT